MSTHTPLTLVIEASTTAGSVALLSGGTLWQRADVAMGASTVDALFPAVQELLEAKPDDASLTEIVCGAGPGSFTSLRIAAAVAKGLTQATGAALFAVPSLLLAAASHDVPGEYLVHSDALRGERYALGVTIDSARTVEVTGEVARVPVDDLLALAAGRSLLAVGAKGSAGTSVPGQPVVADAAVLGRVNAWRERGRVDLASWEPAYGRLAEAQVKWEASHARALPTSAPVLPPVLPHV